jgi:putative phosphoribosyl transferase
VPTGHERIVEKVIAGAKAMYCANIRGGLSFAVADAYRLWCDLGETERVGMVP